MRAFILSFTSLIVVWVLLTSSFNREELVVGGLLVFIIALVTRKYFLREVKADLNPLNWFNIIRFIIYYTGCEVLCVLNVSGMIVTGNIKPNIVRLETRLRDLGKVMLANCITFTPGTLTMDSYGNYLFVHCLRGEKTGGFEKFLGRIWK